MKKNSWLTFTKGILMGLCDLVPGVSGGTIAFITGIYDRLMSAIANTFALLKELITSPLKKKPSRNTLKKADLPFLCTLFGGIIIALLIGSKGVLYLLDNHFSYTISFFIGLIAASAVSISKHLKSKSTTNTLTLIAGIMIGISFVLYAPITTNPGLPYLFISGFLAASALFLPGISGAFVLFLLGVYEYLLALLHDAFRRPLELIVFLLGALLGAYVISKIVHWLFTKNKAITLHGLLGLLIGSLSIPIKRLLIAGIPNHIIATLLVLIGFLTAMIIDWSST